MKSLLSILVGVCLASGCSGPGPLTDIEKEEVIMEVDDMFDHYFADIRKDGLTAEFRYLDSTANFFWIPPGFNSALSYDAVRTIIEAKADDLHFVDYRFETLKIFPLSRNVASYSGIVTGTMTDTSRTVADVNMIESGVLVKRRDGWQLIGGQSANLVQTTDVNEDSGNIVR